MPSFYVNSNFYVKEIKGKYYVYSIEKGEDGKQRHHYIAPLEKIIELALGVLGGYPLTPECRGRDLNPGHGLERPALGGTPPKTPILSNIELKGVRIINSNLTSSNNSEISASDLLKFELALRSKNISEDTIKHYISCIKQNKKDSNNCIKAWRNFYKLVLNRDPPESLKIKKTKADLKIPSLDEIKQTLEKAKQYNSLYILYRILIESGIRESEVLKILNEYDESKDRFEDGIYAYEINWARGYKGSFYAFHITPLQKIKISKAYVDKYVKKLDLVPPKYFRKFVASKLAELGVNFDTIDFIQGRKPSRVLTQHYVSLFGIAKEHYRKYAEWIRQTF
ncbi:hypothetical protein [Sulfolobus spindle-shaped virus]|nr:hypothetical protein [Sulfolobus spindle-shaped virus]